MTRNVPQSATRLRSAVPPSTSAPPLPTNSCYALRMLNLRRGVVGVVAAVPGVDGPTLAEWTVNLWGV